jgi:hypothetical protein
VITQTVVWTLLPDPAEPAQLNLVASPRLSNSTGADGLLSDYPEIANWPAVLTGLAVEIAWEQGTVTVPAVLDGDPPDRPLWQKIFPANLPVVPFRSREDPRRGAETPVVSYPVRSLHRSLAEQYPLLLAHDSSSVAPRARASGATWAHVDRLVQLVGDNTPVRRSLAEPGLDDDQPDDPHGWARFAQFHRSPDPGAKNTFAAAASSSQPDFHKVFASLADHPTLLRRLGLARKVRVTLPAALVQGGAVRQARIRAVPSDPPAVVDFRPYTECVVRNGRLRLATAQGTEAPLHLALDDPDQFAVVDLDTDAAGLSMIAYGATLARQSRTEPPPALRPPALTSDGIFVAQANRQVHFQKSIRRGSHELQADLAAGRVGDQTLISADDVQHGYRVDVFDEASRQWYPLCRRTGAYQIHGGGAPVPFDDEATVSDAMVQGGSADSPLDLLHQSVFRWNGWSLAVPPPGGMLDLDDKTVVTPPTTPPSVAFTMTSRVPSGTLPSLRYGRSYKFRARLVDIAGRSLAFDAAPQDGTPASPARVYHRYEPVPAPTLVARRPVTEGESQAVLVVRTDNSNAQPVQVGPACERHLLPPKAAVITLERHGVLDVAGQNRLDPQAYRLLFDLDKGRVTGSADPGALGTTFIDADSMALPWLPDPLARGLALAGLPGNPDLKVEWPAGASWSDRRPMRLVLTPGADTTTVSVDRTARVVRVSLERGRSLKAALSSHLLAEDLRVMGVWQWYVQSGLGTAAELVDLSADAVDGKVSQLTPATEIRLIHAVRRPLAAPVIARESVHRKPNETSFLFVDDGLLIHPASTMSVHVEAAWTDVVDDPARDDPGHPGPVTVSGRTILELDAEARQQAWSETSTDPEVRFTARGHLGDTRAREVFFTPVATSRYAAFFAQRKTVRLTAETPVPVTGAGFVPGTVTVRAAAGAPANTFSPDRDVLVNAKDGTVARRPGSSIPSGAEVEVVFVAPPVTREGGTVRQVVSASARPLPPVVHSVVPAFKWSHVRSGTTITSIRSGGLMRVFLNRPWLVSGYGEQLAVLVADPDLYPNTADPEIVKLLRRVRTLCSEWGNDPVRLNPHDYSQPLARSDLPRASHEQTVQIPGDSRLLAKAFGHQVEYDPQRQLWFADVLVGNNRYRPFVRLAVARLQLNVVTPDLYLSSPVDAGFHELAPTRTATIELRGADAVVTVAGLMSDTSEFTVSLLTAEDAEADPAVWDPQREKQPTALVGNPVGGSVSATVRLPLPAAGMRLLIREFHVLPRGAGGGKVRRLAYFDSIQL